MRVEGGGEEKTDVGQRSEEGRQRDKGGKRQALPRAERKSYFLFMTTQEKTSAIQKIVKNHQDNVAAAQAANVSPGLNPLVIEAMNNAFKADLEKVFAT